MPHKDPETGRQYRKRYYQMHKKTILSKGKKYRQEFQEGKREYSRNFLEGRRKRDKKYYQTHKKKRLGYLKKYREMHKEDAKSYSKEYRQAHKEDAKDYLKKYRKTSRGKVILAIRKSKHRSLGFNFLNQPIEGYEAHHVDHDRVIFIPEEIHASIKHNVWTGQNMEIINDLAFKFLEETIIN